MKNLEQIRAKNALEAAKEKIAGKEGGELIKKIPPLIMNHGILATGAYAFDDKNEGFKAAFGAIAKHLADKDIALVPSECQSAKGLMEYLSTKADSYVLQQVTAETMAWLSYARRFIKKDKEDKRHESNTNH
jgi:CRISPR/Cas system CMR-associated protein Cmr5 small subunit